MRKVYDGLSGSQSDFAFKMKQDNDHLEVSPVARVGKAICGKFSIFSDRLFLWVVSTLVKGSTKLVALLRLP